MPRGNDASDARDELEKRLGVETNAEALIEAVKDAYPQELKAANAKRENPGARDAVDRSAVESAVGAGTLIDYNVRGDKVVAVVETEQGRVFKQAIALDDLGASGKKAAKVPEPKGDAEDEKASK